MTDIMVIVLNAQKKKTIYIKTKLKKGQLKRFNMTPKEKAEEIFDKHYRLFNNFPNYQYVIENLNTIQDEKLYTAKQCALIAVDEILLIFYDDMTDLRLEEINYWTEVKYEIEKI